MISYEASKWYVKLWRQRWYLYAIFLHVFRNYLKLPVIIDFLLDVVINEDQHDENEKMRIKWRYIKRHVELTKMYKYTSKTKIYEERE
jgi:hypothetical protein